MTAERLAGTKVLVTGAGGFIGSHLCEWCLRQGANVRAYVHYNSRSDCGMLADLDVEDLGRIEILAGDLRDPHAVARAVSGCEIVFHLGALIGIPYSYENPIDVVSTNVMGTLNVLQACRESKVLRLVQTSTSEVYGTAQAAPMDEAHPLNPQSPYAASKVGSDKLAESFHLSYGIPVTIVRPFNTYGPRQSPRAVLPAIITQALRSSRIRLGRTDPSRDLTFVQDTVRGFVDAASSSDTNGETLNLGSGTEVTVSDLVGLVGKILGKELSIEHDATRVRPSASEVERLLCSSEKAARLMGWKPRISLEEGLERTVRWFRESASRYETYYHI